MHHRDVSILLTSKVVGEVSYKKIGSSGFTGNGFNTWPTFVQQKSNGCWANVGRKNKVASVVAVQTISTLRQKKNQHFREIWLPGTKN